MADSAAPAFNRAYTGLRRDILSILPPKPARVLDIGCAVGSMGRYLSDTFGSRVWGVEYDAAMAEAARGHMQEVWHADLNRQGLSSLPHPGRYDLVICGDVLEHLVDPWQALRDIAGLLEPGGAVAVSLPNIGHFTTLLHLVFLREWPYRARGLHDRTHLRFFTRRNMVRLYRDAGLSIVREKRILRLRESGGFLDPLAALVDFPPFRSFVTFQYLHLLRRP